MWWQVGNHFLPHLLWEYLDNRRDFLLPQINWLNILWQSVNLDGLKAWSLSEGECWDCQWWNLITQYFIKSATQIRYRCTLGFAINRLGTLNEGSVIQTIPWPTVSNKWFIVISLCVLHQKITFHTVFVSFTRCVFIPFVIPSLFHLLWSIITLWVMEIALANTVRHMRAPWMSYRLFPSHTSCYDGLPYHHRYGCYSRSSYLQSHCKSLKIAIWYLCGSWHKYFSRF